MFWEVFAFEVKQRFNRPMLYIFFAVMFAFSFGAMSWDNITIGSAIGNVQRNAPFIIAQFLLVFSILGMFLIPAFVSSALIRDFELETYSSFFTTPVSKFSYLFGRFSAGALVSFVAISGAAFGVLIGSWMPWLDPERIAAFSLSAYLSALFLFALPNVIIISGICYALAISTRSMLYTYIGIVAIFIAYSIGETITADLDNQFLAGLIDPFASASFEYITRYWTPAQRNIQVIGLEPILVINRSIWLGVISAILLLSYARFKFTIDTPSIFKKLKSKLTVEVKPEAPSIRHITIPRVTQHFSFTMSLQQMISKTMIEFWGIVRGVPFIVICLFGIANLINSATFMNSMYGTAVYPVTHLMLEAIDGGFSLFMIIIVTFYAGELVWKERQIKMNVMYDALPVPNWMPLLSKLFALILAIFVVQILAMLASMGIQLYYGYSNFEFALYLKGLFLHRFSGFILLCVLGFFLHVIANNKYIGYMLMVGYYILIFLAAAAAGWTHNLYRFGLAPSSQYSDMNGFGHFVEALVWFRAYWGLFSVLLIVISLLLWVRGTEDRFKIRLQRISGRSTKPIMFMAGLALIGFVLSGSNIFYNTNVMNKYITRKGNQKMQADYELNYKKYQGLIQPRITDVKCEVDIFPAKRMVDIRGTYIIKNKSAEPIDSLHVMIDSDLTINKIDIPASSLVHDDTDYGWYIYELDRPLAPADSIVVAFDVSSINKGFVNSGSNTRVVNNGTFFDSWAYFPHFGYNDGFEISDKNERRKHDLPPKERMAAVDDSLARMDVYVGTDADWVTFEATVSTSPDQIAIAPGYLQKEWQENGRRYFHYKMDAPILNFYSFLSANYQVKRDKWQAPAGGNDVDIEIYYHEPHTYNVERMIDAVKKSLDYYTENFSPYQHRQARIIEFPGYSTFAQSFPNTIPYSESIGFIARVKELGDVDYVFYVTAHEIAHQWWAHQVIGGNVQGATVMSETMSQYSAMMVMEREYGKDHMRKFLKYELDRYLRGRAGEQLKELPLMLVEDQQYIHYRKGSVIMYALKDYIGEDNLNRALAAYIDSVGFQQPPYTNSLEFLSFIREATPDSLQYILEDMFETITLYENKTKDAVFTKTDDGRFKLTLTIETKKVRADSLGNETEIPIDDWIDVGIFAGEPKSKIALGEKVLYLQKHKITRSTTKIEIIVDEVPGRAGIDPYNKLIDRQADDNTKKVKELL